MEEARPGIARERRDRRKDRFDVPDADRLLADEINGAWRSSAVYIRSGITEIAPAGFSVAAATTSAGNTAAPRATAAGPHASTGKARTPRAARPAHPSAGEARTAEAAATAEARRRHPRPARETASRT